MIHVNLRDGVMKIQISRPAAKNAITLEMYDAMSDALERASAQASVRVVLFHGDQGIFTSGNDLNDFVDKPPSGEDSPVYRFLQALVSFEKPLVGAVDGWAVGIGTTMLLHCDLVYASTRAKFKMPFVELALVPEAGSSLILPRMMGHQKAAELLFFSQVISASKAESLGFVNEVLEPEELMERARERALAHTKLAPEALRLTKQLLCRPDLDTLKDTMRVEADLFIERLASPDLAEAIQAFFQKRPPNFS